MSTIAHFMNVGQGNMTLLQLNNGQIMLYDCNVTNDNQNEVLTYIAKIIGWGTNIDIFVNSHRDADHMRGIKKIHKYFPIQKVWDSGVTGGTPECSAYKEYMDLRRNVGFITIEKLKIWGFGKTKLRVMNSKNDDLSNNHNAQSIVIKVEHHDTNKKISSLMLTGDTDALSWKDSIMQSYSSSALKSQILLASHHGSKTFFDDPSDQQYYFEKHLEVIKPEMTIISVGDNGHGHPHEHSIKIYEKHTTGSNKGNKIRRTDLHGNIRLELKDNAKWSLVINK